MRFSLSVALGAFAYAMAVVAIGWLVFLDARGKIEEELIHETRLVLAQGTPEKALERIDIRFDGLNGEVHGLVVDEAQRAKLAETIESIHGGGVPSLKGKVMALANHLKAPALCRIDVEKDGLYVLQGQFPDRTIPDALIEELEQFAGTQAPPGTIRDMAEVSSEIQGDAPWMEGVRPLLRALLSDVRPLHLTLFSNQKFRVEGSVTSEALKEKVLQTLASHLPRWRLRREAAITVEALPPDPQGNHRDRQDERIIAATGKKPHPVGRASLHGPGRQRSARTGSTKVVQYPYPHRQQARQELAAPTSTHTHGRS